MPETSPLFVFIDESGNLDFSGKGTNHFVLTAFMTGHPSACAASLTSLRYEFLSRGLESQVPFHATYNSHGTRLRVIENLCTSDHAACAVHSVYVDKHFAHPSKHKPDVFFALMAGALAKYILKAVNPGYSPIVLMFDSVLTGKQRNAVLKVIKPTLNALGRQYYVTFKPVKEDVNGQIADYYAWSLFRHLEAGDGSWLSKLPQHGRFNLFANGHTRYW